MSYELISSTTLSSPSSIISVSSLPQTFRDLVVVIEGLSSSGTKSGQIRINGSSASIYSHTTISGNGSGSANYTSPNIDWGQLTEFSSMTTSNRATWVINFMEYSTNTKHKHLLARVAAPNAGMDMVALRWGSTDAITSFAFDTYSGNAGNFATGTTVTIYVVKG